MREHVSQSKKATTASFSIPSLKHRIPGFGLDSSQASPQAVPLVQPLHKPLTHDISRIPLRNPQAKLSISQPGDKYEQEADSVAQQVMQRIAQPINRQSIQPQALPESEELQMKPLANSIRPLVQRQEMPEDEEELQMKSLDNSTLQRQEVPKDDEELQMKSMVQRQAGMDAAPDLETSINQARGGGQAMADNIRHPMEVAFGADFSGVKVHTDGQSDQLNRSIQARAFTTGQDVFFRQGEYNPGSRGGQELIAHELTHVVQQNGGAVQRSSTPQPKVLGSADQKEVGEDERGQGIVIEKQYTLSATNPKETINRTMNTAVKALSKQGIKNVKKVHIKAKFLKMHELPEDTTVETVQQALTQYKESHAEIDANASAARQLERLKTDATDVSLIQEDIEVYLDNDQLKHQPTDHPIGTRQVKKGNQFKSNYASSDWHRNNTLPVMLEWATGLGLKNGEEIPTGQAVPRDGIHYEGKCLKVGEKKYVLFHCYPANTDPRKM